MVQRYEQTRKLQWYKRGAAYLIFTRKNSRSPHFEIIFINLQALTMTRQGHQQKK